MKSFIHNTSACLIAVVAFGVSATVIPVQAQTQRAQGVTEGQGHDEHDHEGRLRDHAQGTETIAFQLPRWKTMHFDDAAKATKHADTLKKLGCEVKQGQHAGHIDLTYRCVQWKSMDVETHQLAGHWSGWLKSSGFDVSHAHPDPVYAKGNEALEFRLVNWKSIHGKGSGEEKKFVDLLSKLGCEVVESEHGGHSDIKFRAPTWRSVHVTDQKAADELGTWLKANGFEVAPHKH